MEAAKQMVDAVTEGVKKASIGGEKGAKKEKKGKPPSADTAGASPLEMNPPPEFLKTRLELFDRLKKKYDEEVAKKPREKITVTMPDNLDCSGASTGNICTVRCRNNAVAGPFGGMIPCPLK